MDEQTVEVKPSFSLNRIVFEEFNLKRSPSEQGDIDIDFSPFGLYNKEQRTFQLNLILDLTDESESFKMHLNTVGLFDLSENCDFYKEESLFLLNAPAILFPYIRSYVSSITALSGMDTINLPIMNLSFLKEKLKNSIVEE